MRIGELDTPVLLVDRQILLKNVADMQAYADANGVKLRPHAKTHKCSRLAKLQLEAGAVGIAVAKVGEAEVMAAAGCRDIFIANEIVGEAKFARIRALKDIAEISFGIDSEEQLELAEASFAAANATAQVLVEIEVGEERSGVTDEESFRSLIRRLKACRHVEFLGVFSHDGHSYGAESLEEVERINREAQERTLRFAGIAAELGLPAKRVSVGSTPSLFHGFPVLPGVTELRPGTYILMDAAQAAHYGTAERCAATVLATVISRPAINRTVLDTGAKCLTMQTRTKGLCKTAGLGLIKDRPGVSIARLYDEHAVILSESLTGSVRVGDKLEIIPNHICPVMNLQETVYLVENGEVLEEIPVDCRGKLR